MECPTCFQSQANPFRNYVNGKISEGCIDDFHTGHLMPGQTSAWHNRPWAKEHRAKIAENQKEMDKELRRLQKIIARGA